ncbi:MAG: NADH-quinone oxidoreductase subunit N [Acidobacteria bacterium]|nr:NADH-quinone oxidoreductase subunit N [Acidobacteriota bacterium]
MTPLFTAADFFTLKPAIALCSVGCIVLFAEWAFRSRGAAAWVALFGELLTAYALWVHSADVAANGPRFALSNSMTIDGFSVFFGYIFVVSAILAIIISARYMEDEKSNRSEFYALMLFAQAGMTVMAQGYDLVTLFIGLELMALSFYVMVGFLRDELRSNEAAMKYLILGALSSGFLAYGFSILYGISGSTNLSEIADAVASRDLHDPILILAMVTTSVGLFFKISVVPFHMWAPDVYEGAPTPVTAYISVASKAASFALLMRIFLVPLVSAQEVWIPLLGGVALATMTLGNIAAITQNNLKRLLAYSSISHAGYILLGLVAGNETGLKGVSVYILVYMFMNFGVFALIAAMRRDGHAAEDIDDLGGLMGRHPGYAILMLILLLSLAGIPPTAGFYGKYFIFLGLLQAGQYFLAIVAALYVAVATYYYFRIIRAIFLSDGLEPATIAPGLGTKLALVASGVFTLVIGLYPEPFINMATNSILLALR